MKGKQKKLMLKIIVILIAILIMGTFVPFHTSNAANIFESILGAAKNEFKENMQNIFNHFSKFLADIADIVIQSLQKFFLGDGTIELYTINTYYKTYFIRYSPGVIFSGNIPAFDINFISPQEDYEVNQIQPDYADLDNIFGTFSVGNDNITYYEAYDSVQRAILKFSNTGEITSSDDKILVECYDVKGRTFHEPSLNSYTIVFAESIQDTFIGTKEEKDSVYNVLDLLEIGYDTENSTINSDEWYYDSGSSSWANRIENVSYNGQKKDYVRLFNYRYIYITNEDVDTGKRYAVILDVVHAWFAGEKMEDGPYKINFTVGEITRVGAKLVKTGETIESSASRLQKTISTWYNVMKTIAVIGLLSVLVYVAIRMIISSSTEDKAKYKKMLGDWLAAICLIYLLHYFMALTLTILEAICDVFKASVIGENGQDILMSSIRTTIERGNSFKEQFANIIIYLVLVILTVMFTYQYLKRFIYAAFLTMIAPLIALTYPLDKIKDGKAQAYTVWLREYLFTVLIQAVHLIIYYVLVGGMTTDLLDGTNPEVYNPVYAIAAISFILPAEKFIRNMFGFNKAEAANTMGSALGGAALMQAINNLGRKPPKGPKGSEGEKGEEKNAKVRTANPGQDPYSALKGGQAGENAGNGNAQAQGEKRSIKKGIGNVAKKYVFNKKTAKGLLKTGGRIAGASTLGMVGLAAGISTGEVENAFAGVVGGIAAGSRVGGNLVDGGANLINGVSGGIREIGDTFGEGAYGKEEYARMKFDKEFKKSSEYKNLTKDYPGQEGNIDEFLNAGITDTKQMGIAMKNIKEGKYSVEEAVGYMKMAQAPDFPADILYDEEMFKTYLGARGIPESEAERIRRGIVDFK